MDGNRKLAFLCQDSGLAHIFKLIACTSEKILNNTNVEVKRQVKGKQLPSGSCPWLKNVACLSSLLLN